MDVAGSGWSWQDFGFLQDTKQLKPFFFFVHAKDFFFSSLQKKFSFKFAWDFHQPFKPLWQSFWHSFDSVKTKLKKQKINQLIVSKFRISWHPDMESKASERRVGLLSCLWFSHTTVVTCVIDLICQALKCQWTHLATFKPQCCSKRG